MKGQFAGAVFIIALIVVGFLLITGRIPVKEQCFELVYNETANIWSCEKTECDPDDPNVELFGDCQIRCRRAAQEGGLCVS